ncbi:MAG: hypothetical protein ACM37W_19155 [Actinomycetota bacterium]
MVQDVRQWLEEIQRLQQQLAQAIRDRDAALESADQWRQLYNTEAQQRRTDAQQYQQTINALKAEIQKFQNFSSSLPDEGQAAMTHQQQIESLQTVEELKARLVETLLERDRTREELSHLVQALQQEQADHAETRKSLTSALGDAVDLLAKAQNPSSTAIKLELEPASNSELPPSTPAELPASTNTLLQLPPVRN